MFFDGGACPVFQSHSLCIVSSTTTPNQSQLLLYILEKKLKFSIAPAHTRRSSPASLLSPSPTPGQPSPSQIAFPLLPSSICLILALTLPPSEYTRLLQAPHCIVHISGVLYSRNILGSVNNRAGNKLFHIHTLGRVGAL